MLISNNSNTAQAKTLLAAPLNFASDNITDASFDLVWDAEAYADRYQVDVSDDIGFSNIIFTDIVTDLTVNIDDLDVGTYYYCRIRAYNDSDEAYGVYSYTLEVQTVLATPVATTATSITGFAFYANWNAVENADGYKIDVSEHSDFSDFVSGFEDLDVGDVTTYGVTGLDPETDYYYRVRAYSTASTSASSNTINATTGVALEAPVADEETSVTESSFTANWESVGDATGYRLDVSEHSDFSDFVSGFEDLDVGDVTSYSVTGLDAETNYYYRVRATNSTYTSDDSDIISVTTDVTPSFVEDFSDGDYTSGNVWTVDTGAFAVNNSVSNPLNTNQYSLVCNTAGFLYVPNTQSYGRWEFDVYKNADANVLALAFKQGVNGLYDGTGYEFIFTGTEVANINKRTSGSYGTIMQSAASYLALQTWYRFRIDRDASGQFSLYVKGGSFGSSFVLVNTTGGSGTNPATDNSITTSAYLLINLTAGDRISNIKLWQPL